MPQENNGHAPADSNRRGRGTVATDRDSQGILAEGRNCWKIAGARRAAFLVDGASYFAAFAAAAERARQAIYILGWDMDSRMSLFRDDRPRGLPDRFGDFMNAIISRRRGLHAYLLNWDFSVIYAFEREPLPALWFDWATHRRLHFRLDNRHPILGAHHQKVIVLDDAMAFVGGLDFTRSRWDTCEHRIPDPRRTNYGGDPYVPFHDVMIAVDGEAAACLGDLARERWRAATGERLHPHRSATDPWPPDLVPDLENVPVGIARTFPAFNGSLEIREVERLYRDAIAAAVRWIYIENQYLTSHAIAEALASRLEERDGPEIVIVAPKIASGGLEESTMGILRGRFLKRLRGADRHGRLGVYYPVPPGEPGGFINVHSKVFVVDDRLARVGSANLSNRSMGLDTECDLAVEARGDGRAAAAIAAFRNRLLGEHLGREPGAVAEAAAARNSLVGAIESLRGSGRTLEPLEGGMPEWQDRIIPDSSLIDWERPVIPEPETVIRTIMPEPGREPARRGILRGVVILVGLFLLAAAWIWTPMREWLSVDALTAWAGTVRESPAAPLIVIAAYVVGGLLVFPVTLLIVATAFTFGPFHGFTYSLAGSVASALVTYGIGRLIGKGRVRSLLGGRLARLGRLFRRNALVAVATVRVVPVAPYTVINVVAGAFRIPFGDFVIGTVIGMVPGVFAITVLGKGLWDLVRSPEPKSFAVLAAVVGAIVLAAIWVRRLLERREGRFPAGGGRRD
jgi:phospholipase D1/2